MNIEGTYTLQASPATLWQCLLDPQVLRATIPGLQQIERTNDTHYNLLIRLNQKPLNGTHHVYVDLSGQHFPIHYTMTILGDDSLSTLNGTIEIYLRGNEHSTVVSYRGSFTLAHTRTNQSSMLTKGAIKLFIQQYFQALTSYLRTNDDSLTTAKDSDDILVIYQQNTHQESLASLSSLPSSPSLLGRCIQLFHLGHDDPAQQYLLEQRLRRFGVVSILLILVWVGTRIPQRR
jgi:carbon monoxide dehydrogenase subunit G